jgi:hypothetical protein
LFYVHTEYIPGVYSHLTLITSSTDIKKAEHTDLLTYLFGQLKESQIPPFRTNIEKMHVSYLEANMADLTPHKLLKLATDKIQVLRDANQWKTCQEQSLMALKLELQQQKQESDKIIHRLVAHVGKITNQIRYSQPFPNDNTRHGGKRQCDVKDDSSKYPTWMITPPTGSQQTILMDRCLHTWCTKCHLGKGLWVCRHNTATHVDGYSHQRITRPRYQETNQNGVKHDTRGKSYSARQAALEDIDATPTAQLSLLDYLDSCLPEGNEDVPDDNQDDNVG